MLSSMTKFACLLLCFLGSSITQAFKLNLKKDSALLNTRGLRSTVTVAKITFMKPITPLTEVPLGESVYLECSALGNSAPTIHWLKNGKRISQGTQNDITDDEALNDFSTSSRNARITVVSRLFIDCADPDDIGEYVCVAEIPTQRISQTTVVEVVAPVRDEEPSTCSKIAVPARIYMWTKARMDTEKSTVQLFCRAEGIPTPKVTWLDTRNKPINTKDPNYMVLSNGDLVVSNISRIPHQGTFTCVADNGVGSMTSGTFLYPMAK